MLSVESLQVAEEEVVESSSNKFGDIYTFVAKGCFPQTMNPLRKKNLKRYAQKFIIDGKGYFNTYGLPMKKNTEGIALSSSSHKRLLASRTFIQKTCQFKINLLVRYTL